MVELRAPASNQLPQWLQALQYGFTNPVGGVGQALYEGTRKLVAPTEEQYEAAVNAKRAYEKVKGDDSVPLAKKQELMRAAADAEVGITGFDVLTGAVGGPLFFAGALGKGLSKGVTKGVDEATKKLIFGDIKKEYPWWSPTEVKKPHPYEAVDPFAKGPAALMKIEEGELRPIEELLKPLRPPSYHTGVRPEEAARSVQGQYEKARKVIDERTEAQIKASTGPYKEVREALRDLNEPRMLPKINTNEYKGEVNLRLPMDTRDRLSNALLDTRFGAGDENLQAKARTLGWKIHEGDEAKFTPWAYHNVGEHSSRYDFLHGLYSGNKASAEEMIDNMKRLGMDDEQVRRAIEQGKFVDMYHGTASGRAKEGKMAKEWVPEGFWDNWDNAGTHAGSYDAAKQSPGYARGGENAEIFPWLARGRSPLLLQGRVPTEDVLSTYLDVNALTNIAEKGPHFPALNVNSTESIDTIDKAMKERYKRNAISGTIGRRDLSDRGYDIFPYVNAAEDTGGISFILPETHKGQVRLPQAEFNSMRQFEPKWLAGLAPAAPLANEEWGIGSKAEPGGGIENKWETQRVERDGMQVDRFILKDGTSKEFSDRMKEELQRGRSPAPITEETLPDGRKFFDLRVPEPESPTSNMPKDLRFAMLGLGGMQ